MDPDAGIDLLFFFAFLALGAFVVLCQNSLVEFSDQKLRRSAGESPALERIARLMEHPEELPGDGEVEVMLNAAWETLRGAGYVPYYLYRQKYMSGSFENVGWAKPGYASLYNIAMMEELHTILALGGGGVTKQVWPGTGKIERIANPKYPQEYLRDIDRICAGKRELIPFLAETKGG